MHFCPGVVLELFPTATDMDMDDPNWKYPFDAQMREEPSTEIIRITVKIGPMVCTTNLSQIGKNQYLLYCLWVCLEHKSKWIQSIKAFWSRAEPWWKTSRSRATLTLKSSRFRLAPHGRSRSLASKHRPPPRQLAIKYKTISGDVVHHQLVSVNSSNNTSTWRWEKWIRRFMHSVHYTRWFIRDAGILPHVDLQISHMTVTYLSLNLKWSEAEAGITML